MNQSQLTLQEHISAMEELIRPVDFDDLIRTGVLKKEGKANWYVVLKPDELPKHASLQANACKRSTDKPICLRIPKPSAAAVKEVEKLKKLLRKEL